MKKLITTISADIAMGAFDAEGERRVRAWFDRLENWDADEAVRKMSVPLETFPGVYVLRPPTDLRIFFRIDDDTVTILEITNKSVLLEFGRMVGVN